MLSTEERMRSKLEERAAELAGQPHGTQTTRLMAAEVRSYASYLNFLVRERTLEEMRMSAKGMIALAGATFVLAGATAALVILQLVGLI